VSSQACRGFATSDLESAGYAGFRRHYRSVNLVGVVESSPDEPDRPPKWSAEINAGCAVQSPAHRCDHVTALSERCLDCWQMGSHADF